MIALLEKNTKSYLNCSVFIYKRWIYLENITNSICNFSEKNYKEVFTILKLIINIWSYINGNR